VEILTEHKDKSVEYIKDYYDHEADDIIDEYFNTLLENELGFFTDEPHLFPEMSMEWRSPSVITNAIIDIENTIHDYRRVFEELDEFNCKSLEVRCFEAIDLNDLTSMLEPTLDSRLSNISLILKVDPSLTEKAIEKLAKDNKRINSITVHSATEDNSYAIEIGKSGTDVAFIEQQIDSSNHCGVIHTNYFYINEQSVTEALKHNSCLNRKISIDTDGSIKNCPSILKNYGNIKDTTLTEAIAHKDFKDLWGVTKDKIDTCKDCEFRYICSDCRAFVEEPENKHSKPLKCGYDPYTGEWEEWSKSPLKAAAIAHYGLGANKKQ
jgi:SPASM domain peptide maturase of grasp-with-spasm system